MLDLGLGGDVAGVGSHIGDMRGRRRRLGRDVLGDVLHGVLGASEEHVNASAASSAERECREEFLPKTPSCACHNTCLAFEREEGRVIRLRRWSEGAEDGMRFLPRAFDGRLQESTL